MPLKTAKRPAIKRRISSRPHTLRSVRLELSQLRARVDDLEDLRTLNEAIVRNGNKPGIPWEEAKVELGL